MNELEVIIIIGKDYPITGLMWNDFKISGHEIDALAESPEGHYILYYTKKKTAISKLFSKLVSIFTGVIPKDC